MVEGDGEEAGCSLEGVGNEEQGLKGAEVRRRGFQGLSGARMGLREA